MMVVDSHVHIWGANTPDRPWPAGRETQAQRPVPLGAEELLRAMDEAGVERVVIVPPSWEGDRNDLALEAARKHPQRFAVMGRFAAEAPAEGGRLTAWRQQAGMLGVRLTLHRSPWREWFEDGVVDWFWPAAEGAGLPVMVYVPGLVKRLDAVAGRHPGLRLIVDHLALPLGKRDAEAFASLDEVLALARYPNVAVKVSALPCHTSEAYPFPGLHRHIRRVYDAFGPRRMLWGTDYSRLPCPYRQAIALFSEVLDFLSAEDKEWIMGRAAADWLGWPLPAATRRG
ncbi:MAG: amidohydrolase [Candidatus Rokubacteria bacterium]|nr:amidohydrolase [Candidatus Rokubacteria bacterium]